MRWSRVHEPPSRFAGGWSCGVRACVPFPPSVTLPACRNGRRLALARAWGRRSRRIQRSTLGRLRMLGPAPRDWRRRGFGLLRAGRRPFAERLVGEVLACTRPVVGDQTLHRALGRDRESIDRVAGLFGRDRLALLAQRGLEHLGVEVILPPARPLQTSASGHRILAACQRRRRVRARVRSAPHSLQPARPGFARAVGPLRARRCDRRPRRRRPHPLPARPPRRPGAGAPPLCWRRARSRRSAGSRAVSRSRGSADRWR